LLENLELEVQKYFLSTVDCKMSNALQGKPMISLFVFG